MSIVSVAVRPIVAADLGWVLDLNQLHQAELSPLTMQRLGELAAQAFYARVIDQQAAFLIAFDQDADYDSPNFLWFRERMDRFVYVDRITVSGLHRGRGLARRLYEDLFAVARAKELPCVVCEVNCDPPNPASDAFHAALGFDFIGEAHLENRAKTVRYLKRDLSPWS